MILNIENERMREMESMASFNFPCYRSLNELSRRSG